MVSASELVIRHASPEDAAGIAVVHVRSWQVTYRGLMPQDYLDQLDPADRVERWRRHLEETDWSKGGVTVVADNQVRGFIDVGPTRDEDDDAARIGQVRAVYLVPEVLSLGLGRQLMAVALNSLVVAGYAEAILWVHQANDRARRFYSVGGWAPDGGVTDDNSRGFPISEVRYRRSLR